MVKIMIMLYLSTCKIEVSNKGRKCTDTLIVEPLNSLLPFENFTIELYQLEKSLVLLLYFLLSISSVSRISKNLRYKI